MSSLVERIQEDLKQAMREKRAADVSALRMVQADLRNAKIAKKEELTDEEAAKVITKAIKQRKDAALSFREGAREEAAVAEEAEITVLKGYLPEALSEDVVKEIVRKIMAASGATSKKDIGKVMGPVMKEIAGKADGSFVKQLVEAELAARESESAQNA